MLLKDETESKMNTAIEHLKKELKGLRTGRANPAMVEGIKINVYGSEMRIQDIANITTPDPRQILIVAFDANNSSAISKGIQDSGTGLSPVLEGNAIRIKIPSMDEAMRKRMIKMCHEHAEQAKIAIRSERQHANKTIKKQKADGEISEDLVNKQEKEIQNLTDKYCKQVDEICAQKEKDIATI